MEASGWSSGKSSEWPSMVEMEYRTQLVMFPFGSVIR